jgi:GT2 family glycosyltransferase
VRHFLEQCLCSVEKAITTIQAEVWVVDNASTDESIAYLQPLFPWVKFEVNTKNVGFAKANNQVLDRCKGKYILYLNPDTIVPEDCFEQCIAFMQLHNNAGALGIRMLDGSGTFLPESKRAFPSPLTAFFKLSGLSALFPTSKIFARYALGYLDEHQNHSVDVLAGAFMLLRSDIAKKLQGFDETFFMYGEDIDLSYRVKQLGYENYYFSGSSIIHFKGESTKKGSLNYVRMFYQAMSIFVQKHYSSGRATFFAFFIQLAIWMRAALAAMGGVLVKLGFPIIDATLIVAAFYWVKWYWVNYTANGQYFVESMVNITLVGFSLLFLGTATLAGIYDKKYHPIKALYAAGVAIVVMLAIYSLLPETMRFSRGVILFGGLLALLLITGCRWLMLRWRLVEASEEEQLKQPIVIVGSVAEYEEVVTILSHAEQQRSIVGRVSITADETALGKLADLPLLIQQLNIGELVFCVGSLSAKKTIEALATVPQTVRIRFHAAGSKSIVGSDSKDSSGAIVSTTEQYNLAEPYHRRMKRMVDISVAIFILLTFPIQLFFGGFGMIKNAFAVLVGRKTWVGYGVSNMHLPRLRQGVITTGGLHFSLALQLSQHVLETTDKQYAKNYTAGKDLLMIFSNYRNLGKV